MEVNYLIRDFSLFQGNLEEWTNCTDSKRRKKYNSGSLRKRFATSINVEVQDLKAVSYTHLSCRRRG